MFFVAVCTICAISASVAQDFRLTNRTRVNVRRSTSTGPDMSEVIQDLSDLTYTGSIETTAQEGVWYPTTQGIVRQYTTPSRNKPVQLEEAVNLCKNQGGHLWDKKPQLAVGFSNIEYK